MCRASNKAEQQLWYSFQTAVTEQMKMDLSKQLMICTGIWIINHVRTMNEWVYTLANHKIKCMIWLINIQIVLMEADYLVGIRIQDFQSSCDDCGTYFRYCVRSSDDTEQCVESHQHVQTGIALDFSQEFLLLRQNPILFRGPTKEWQVSPSTLSCQNYYWNLKLINTLYCIGITIHTEIYTEKGFTLY